MTSSPKKNSNRWILFGCLAPVGACFILVLALLVVQPLKSFFNLCDFASPPGCQNIYQLGGEINLGHTLALSADGRFLAVANRDLLVLDTTTGQKKVSALLQSDPSYRCETPPAPVAISPSGDYVGGYTFSDNCVFLLKVADGSVVQLQPPTKSKFSAAFIAFSPDGKYFFYTNPDGNQIYQYDLAQKSTTPFLQAWGPLDISPQGLMVVAGKNEIQLWRLGEKPQLERRLPLEMEDVASAALSPDETRLAVVFHLPNSPRRELNSQLIEVNSGKVLADQLGLYNVEFSPDGNFLMSLDGAARLYKVDQAGQVSTYWKSDRLTFTIYDPFGFSSSNLAVDSKSGWMYYGENGMVARFRIP